MKHNEYVVWYPIFQVAIVVSWSSIQTRVMSVIPYLSILMVTIFLKTRFYATSYSLFNISGSSVIGCCGNISYKRFTSSSLCSTNFSTQSLPRTSSMDQEHLHKRTWCVHTSKLYMCIYLFCMWCIAFSLSLYLIHFVTKLLNQLASRCFWNLRIAKMEPWTNTGHRDIPTIFLP